MLFGSRQNLHADRIDQIVQFALARAAQEDDLTHREFGPIHLIKYVYLADLAFARSHQGETFTHVTWIFSHFGPWCSDVFHRLDESVEEIGANVRLVESDKFDKNGKRYSVVPIDADSIVRRLEQLLPSEVTSAVTAAVRNYVNDTTRLLHYVYQTLPMLQAAPNEKIDFRTVIREPMPPQPVAPKLSSNQEKKLGAALDLARRGFRERLAKVRAKDTTPPISAPPRYDEIFQEGLQALDAEAEIDVQGGEVSFPSDIWKSGWRDPHSGE